jgi:hypothetical protein
MKVYPHGIGRDRQAVIYNTVKDHIAQYVQRTYRNGQDAAVSMRNLSVIDITPQESIEAEQQELMQQRNWNSRQV